MKRSGLLLVSLCLSLVLFAQNNGVVTNNSFIALGSLEVLGTSIAVVASWSRNESIRWAILHGCFGWLYVIHFAITRDRY
jgi:hypothetical protein